MRESIYTASDVHTTYYASFLVNVSSFNTTDPAQALMVLSLGDTATNTVMFGLREGNAVAVTTSALSLIGDGGEYLRLWNLRSNASGNGGNPVYFDEMRVGTTWADVTPVPEPASLGVLLLSVLLRPRRNHD